MIYYITYKQGDKIKKAQLDESRYNNLTTNTDVSNITCYSNLMLMEQAYKTLLEGKDNNKKMLLG